MTNATRNKTSRSSYLAALRNKIQEMNSPKSFQKENDDRFWKLTVDSTGTGSAIIRFLPAKIGEEFPFVRMWTHGFKNEKNDKWYIENCPTTLEQECPACQANSELWKAGGEGSPERKLASARKRKLSYISNILVINDPKHPEKNGKNFLFKYGTKIFGKINDLLFPPEEFGDMQVCDPYDMTEGANFKLRQVKVDGFPNYDKSTFDGPSAVGNEDMLNQIEEQLYSLNNILDPKNFKTYDALQKHLEIVLGVEKVALHSAPEAENDKPPFDTDDDLPVAHPKTQRQAAPQRIRTARPRTAPTATDSTAPAVAIAAAAAVPDEQDYFTDLAQKADDES